VSTPLLPRPSWAQIFSTSYSQTPSAYVPPSVFIQALCGVF
jgi:hypothetical protein